MNQNPSGMGEAVARAHELGLPFTTNSVVDSVMKRHLEPGDAPGNLATRWWAVLLLKRNLRYRDDQWLKYKLPLGAFSGGYDQLFGKLSIDDCGGFLPHHLGRIRLGIEPDPNSFGPTGLL